ncbi:MAG: AAA family ATPase, partial [Pseudomonadota bacterium]
LYEGFFGLESRPFLTAPDPGFLYLSEGHQLALTMLRYGILTRAPVTVVTGAVGAGKTTLIRQILNELPGEQTVGLISNMQEGRGDLLHWVLMALDAPFDPKAGHVALFQQFQQLVVDAYAAGRRVLLIFDEAQNLGMSALEELRMLSNINADKDELLQIILVGQPQLRDLMNRPELVQFAQRISADFDLEPLRQRETEEYILRRLEIAGADGEIFTHEALRMVHHATGGVPRLINVLCDMALVYAYADETLLVDEQVLQDFLASARRRGIYRQFSQPEPAPRLVPTPVEA